MRVLLINDSTSNPNWGDRAAAISLREMISHSGGEIVAAISEDNLSTSSFCERSISREENSQRSLRETFKPLIPPVLLKMGRKLLPNTDITSANRLIPQTWDDFPKSAKAILANDSVWSDFRHAIRDVDVVIIHGDGAMVGNGLIPRTDLFLTYLIKTYFEKSIIIVNHTTDFDHPNLRTIAEHVYPLYDDVVFRDPISAERCKNLCTGRFAADTAFWFEPAPREQWTPISQRLTYFDVWPDTARFDPSEPYLCIGSSSKYGYEKSPFPIRRTFVALVKHIQSLYTGQVVLTASDLTDQAVFRPIADQLGLPLIGVTIPVQQAVDILGNADAYIGGRWHPSIFALRGGTPIIPISAKTFKMQALVSLAGLPSLTFDALNLESGMEAMGEQLSGYLDEGSSLRASIAGRARELNRNSWDNVTYLKDYGTNECMRKSHDVGGARLPT